MDQLLDVLLDIKSILQELNLNVENLTGSVNEVKNPLMN